MQRADSLIRTKLHLPFTRLELVSRPRPQERIAQGLRRPLTLITAPAGFGKTILVASCIVTCGMPVAWLSLERYILPGISKVPFHPEERQIRTNPSYSCQLTTQDE
ncbi:MAG: hypothetical protein PHS96_08750 [Anaerolineales bacterium]|nr:hypothetical protein [Anaerolineales bacterium]